MDRIKYENVTSNYNSFEEFSDACNDKKLLLGAFYVTNTIHEYNKMNIDTDFTHNITIHYSVFDPIYYCITKKRIPLAVKKGYVLKNSDLDTIIENNEKLKLGRYIKRYYRDSKIDYKNDILEIEYL